MISKISAYSNTNLLKNIYFQKNSHDNSKTNTYVDNSNIKSVYKDPNLIHTSWFYVNDVHGKMTKMERIVGMSQEFESTPASHFGFFNKNDDVIKMKVSSGDISIGSNLHNNQVAYKFLDWCKFNATILGNHEMDIVEPNEFSKLLDNTKCKMLALNVDVDKNSPLYGKFEKSIVVEKNGEKFGIIGIAPSDMFERVKINDSLKSIKVKDVDETIKVVQQEVDKLRAQGINKIILLSHSGKYNDKKIVNEVDGIDIIFGGHTHNLIEGLKADENLFYSKSGEPVIITQAGKNGEYIGVLNVDFDKNGVIRRAQNNVISTAHYNRPLYVKDAVEKIIGKPEIVGKVDKAVPMPKNTLIEDNPHGNLIVDSMKYELGTDIAILNTGNIRGSFTPKTSVDSRLLADISPFEDKMMVVKLSEKQIVDAIKFGLEKSFDSKGNKPGILLVSGLKYTCNRKGQLLKLEYIDKNNQLIPIDINNPRADKLYTVAVDDFFAMGGDNYLSENVKDENIISTLDFDKNKLACDYIKKLKQPFNVVYDGRITIVD